MQLSDDSETEIASKIQWAWFHYLVSCQNKEGDEDEGCVTMYYVPPETCVLWYDEAMDINNPLASYFVTWGFYTTEKNIARLFNKYTAYDC